MRIAGRWTLGIALTGALATAGAHLYAVRALQDTDNGRHFPALTIERPVWQRFDASGQVRHTLGAARMTQRDGEPARLVEPRLGLDNGGHGAWRAEARRGTLLDTQQTVILEDAVRLAGEPGDAGPVVSSEHLRISALGERIETDRTVVIESASWHVSARGLRAGPGLENLELLGHVRGRHE